MSPSEHRLCRLAERAAEAEDPLRALEILVELRHELDAVTRLQAARGLRAGRSFGDLARVLGISRQAAHRRFRDQAPVGSRLAATEGARRVLRVAGEEAVRAEAGAIGSDHVLIAVLRCGDGVGEMLLREGVTLAGARDAARAIAVEGPTTGPRDLLRVAAQVSIARGSRWLDVESVLTAALADSRGGARRVLTALGVDAAAIRELLLAGSDVPHPPIRCARTSGRAA